jgi:hypothetical protein
MSAVRLDRGPGLTPWLLHASTVAEVDEHLTSSAVCREEELVDRLLDLRNQLRALESPA